MLMHRHEDTNETEPMIVMSPILTAHNWQKRKSRFFTCSCRKIYRVEADVGLSWDYNTKSQVYLFPIIRLKLWFLWRCETLGHFMKIGYFVNSCLIKMRILKSFCKYVAHIIVIICHINTFYFHFIDFYFNTDFLTKFCVFTVNHLEQLKDCFLKNTFKKQKSPTDLFFPKTIGSNNSFTLNESNFQVIRIAAKFEFKVTVRYDLWAKSTQLWLFKLWRWIGCIDWSRWPVNWEILGRLRAQKVIVHLFLTVSLIESNEISRFPYAHAS